jgi:hypothetical protein
MDSSHTSPMHEKEDDKSSSVELAMFDTENDKSSSVDLKIFDIEDSNASDLDDCCPTLKKWSQVFKYLVYLLLVLWLLIKLYKLSGSPIRRDVGEGAEGQQNPDAIN